MATAAAPTPSRKSSWGARYGLNPFGGYRHNLNAGALTLTMSVMNLVFMGRHYQGALAGCKYLDRGARGLRSTGKVNTDRGPDVNPGSQRRRGTARLRIRAVACFVLHGLDTPTHRSLSMHRSATLLALTFAPSLASAVARPSFGISASRPTAEESAWPANGRIVLEGERDAFQAESLQVTIDGETGALVDVGETLQGRAFEISPAPAEGAVVHIEGDPCPADAAAYGDTCALLVLDFVAGPALEGTVLYPPVPLAFDLFDHGDYWPDGCGLDAGAAMVARFGELAPLPEGARFVVTLNGRPIFDAPAMPEAIRYDVPLGDEASGQFCLEARVENAAGGHNTPFEQCDPCRARVTTEVPLELPAPFPTFLPSELKNPGACFESDGLPDQVPEVEETPVSEVEETPVAEVEETPASPLDDTPTGSEKGATADAASEDEGGCSQRPGSDTAPWALLLLGALRRRRAR